jgi:hypothetical protein
VTSAIGLAQGFAGAKQRLGRYAAPVRALAPDQLAFDHREGEPTVPKADSDRFSSNATTKTHDVEFLRQLRTSVATSDVARYEECSREAQSSIRPWYRFRLTRGGTMSLASRRYEGVVDTFV